jgi:hypothetical protein
MGWRRDEVGPTRMLAPKKVRMAMAVERKNRHYLWHSMLGLRWDETARRCGVGAAFRPFVEEIWN